MPKVREVIGRDVPNGRVEGPGKDVAVRFRMEQSPVPYNPRTITIAPDEVVLLGEVTFSLGQTEALPSIDAPVGQLRISYDSVDRRPDVVRPTRWFDIHVDKAADTKK